MSLAMLSVTVKTVKQQTIKIEVGQTATALDLKGQIQESLGAEFPAENQKLIFKGKILQDTAIIGEIGLNETSFVVVMVSKPKPAPVPVATPPAPAPPPAADAPQASSAPDEPAAPEGASGETQLTHDQMVENLMEMTGNSLPREHVSEVLTRSNNNPVIAGAILAGGMDDLQDPSIVQGAMGLPAVPQGGGANPLEFLRTQPQFQQLRTVLQSNPDALMQILSQIQQSNPDLFELINNNRSQFMQMMNDPAIDPVGATGGQEGPLASQAPLASQGGQGVPPGAISVSQTEMQAINRLKALGFPEHMVVQAYFACDKNEEMAANFLLSENLND